MRILLVTAALGALAVGACSRSENTNAEGPAVSPSVDGASAPRNDAVNPDANMAASGQTPGASSFTEGQARGRIENAGYTNVGTLTQDAEGVWRGTASRAGGGQTEVSVDYRGAVTPPGPESGANAEAAGEGERASDRTESR